MARPVERRRISKGPLLSAETGMRPESLGERILNPAFNPVASHAGQSAISTYRSIAADAGPELVNRLDVRA